MNALTISKYIICKCNKLGEEVTKLKLQKLLFFTEAYYMAITDKNELFNEKFYAWTYGPVCKEVYDKYKKYYDLPIKENDCDKLEIISYEIEKVIDIICETFGSFSTSKLVNLTHMKNSPWYNTYTNSSTPISKKETKEWFKENFLNNGI